MPSDPSFFSPEALAAVLGYQAGRALRARLIGPEPVPPPAAVLGPAWWADVERVSSDGTLARIANEALETLRQKRADPVLLVAAPAPPPAVAASDPPVVAMAGATLDALRGGLLALMGPIKARLDRHSAALEALRDLPAHVARLEKREARRKPEDPDGRALVGALLLEHHVKLEDAERVAAALADRIHEPLRVLLPVALKMLGGG